MYVLEGAIDYFYKELNSDEVKYIKVLNGETIFTPNLVSAILHLSHNLIIIASKSACELFFILS